MLLSGVTKNGLQERIFRWSLECITWKYPWKSLKILPFASKDGKHCKVLRLLYGENALGSAGFFFFFYFAEWALDFQEPYRILRWKCVAQPWHTSLTYILNTADVGTSWGFSEKLRVFEHFEGIRKTLNLRMLLGLGIAAKDFIAIVS